MIWCPKCKNCWLDNSGCPQCRLSVEELLEYLIELVGETKESDGVSIDQVTDVCMEMDCGVARRNESLQEKIDDQDEEMTAINAENWKLKRKNARLKRELKKFALEYNGLCPNCENPIKRNRCSVCFFEGNQLVVSMINSLKKKGEASNEKK